MGKSKDLASGAAYVETSGDTMTGNLGIGIGSDSAQGTLDVRGAIVTSNSTTSYWKLDRDDSTGSFTINDTGANNRMLIDTSGRVTKPYQPSFIATRASNHVIGTTDAVIPIDSEDLDVGNNYNTSTYSYTAPIAGNYFFAFQSTINSINTGTYNACYLRKNGSGTGYRFRTLTGSGWTGINGSCIIYLAANDYVNMYGYVQSGSMTLQGAEVHFMGYLIG